LNFQIVTPKKNYKFKTLNRYDKEKLISILGALTERNDKARIEQQFKKSIELKQNRKEGKLT